jgi:hypothetical protein
MVPLSRVIPKTGKEGRRTPGIKDVVRGYQNGDEEAPQRLKCEVSRVRGSGGEESQDGLDDDRRAVRLRDRIRHFTWT